MGGRSCVFYDRTALIDTSAIIALCNEADHWHQRAADFFYHSDLSWIAVDVTAHEVYTRTRYDLDHQSALERYQFLRRDAGVNLVRFTAEDECSACDLLVKYAEHKISFHDALCAAVMLRVGAYRVFAFDKHFWIMGFEMMPGMY